MESCPFCPQCIGRVVSQRGTGTAPHGQGGGICLVPAVLFYVLFATFSDDISGTNLWKSEGDAAKRPSINSVTNGVNTGFKSIYGNYGIYGREKTG